MDVLDAIADRRTVRKFLDIPVEEDKLGTILEAGTLAPSPGNLQTWKFIVVRDSGKKEALADASLQQFWMTGAPVFIVICAEIKKMRSYYGKRGVELYAVQECAAAAENMMLAAHALELGSFWVGAFDTGKAKMILNIPDGVDVEPQIILGFGYPDEKPNRPLRLRLENITFFERWSAQSIGKIRDVNAVLWNYRLLERGLRASREGLQTVEKAVRQESKKTGTDEKAKKLWQRIIEQGRKLRQQIEQKVKREKKP